MSILFFFLQTKPLSATSYLQSLSCQWIRVWLNSFSVAWHRMQESRKWYLESSSSFFFFSPRLKKLKCVQIDKVKKEFLSLKWKETIRYPTRKECSPWIQWNWTAYSLENCFKVAAVEIDFQMTLLFRRPPPCSLQSLLQLTAQSIWWRKTPGKHLKKEWNVPGVMYFLPVKASHSLLGEWGCPGEAVRRTYQ